MIMKRMMTYQRLLLVGMSILHVFLRFPGIMQLPLFNDELIYLNWARGFPQNLLNAIEDGRFLHTLLMAPILQFPMDHLLMGRILSIVCGLGNMVLLVRIGRDISSPSVGWLSAFIYTIAPMSILHERLLLTDSLLTFGSLLVLLSSLRYAQQAIPTTKSVLLIGFALMLSALVKISGMFFFIIPIVVVVFMMPTWNERKERLVLLRRALIVALATLAILAPLHYGGGLRDFVEFSSITERLAIVGSNSAIAVDWFLRYFSAALLIPIAVVLVRPTTSTMVRRYIVMLSTITLFIIVIYALFSVRIYPRYFFPALPTFLLASSLALVELWSTRAVIMRAITLASVTLAIMWGGWNAFLLATNPPAAPIAALDRWQYIEGWTAGYNLDAMMARIRQEADTQGRIIVVNHARGRLIHMAAFYFLAEHSAIQLERVELTESPATGTIEAFARQAPTYLLLDGEEFILLDVPNRFPRADILYTTQHPYSDMRFYLLRYRGTS